MARLSQLKHFIHSLKNTSRSTRQPSSRLMEPTPIPYPEDTIIGASGRPRNQSVAASIASQQYRLLLEYGVLDMDDPQCPENMILPFDTAEDLIDSGRWEEAAERLRDDWHAAGFFFNEANDNTASTEIVEMIRERVEELGHTLAIRTGRLFKV